MTPRSTICPVCRKLNGAGTSHCYACGARMPGKIEDGLRSSLHGILGAEAPLTRLYIIICVGVYLFTALRGNFKLMGGVPISEALRWGALCFDLDGWLPENLAVTEPWRHVSAMFVHFGILHIVFNMMTLNDLGRTLESQMGSARFVIAFLVTGVLGFVASDLWYFSQQAPYFTAGASGGLTGLIGVYVGVLYARRDPAWKQVLMRVLVYAIILALMMPANNAAHAGGFVAGWPIGYVFWKQRHPGKYRLVLGTVAVALVLMSIFAIVLSHQSPAWKAVRQEELRLGA